MPNTSIRCPSCGHVLLTVDLPAAQALTTSRDPNPEAPVLIRVAEAARLLSISRSTLYQLVSKGEVSVVRIERSVRVSRREVERIAGG